MCKHAVKKLPFIIRDITGQYETQHMCDKAVLENGAKTVDNYPYVLEFVPERYKTKNM